MSSKLIEPQDFKAGEVFYKCLRIISYLIYEWCKSNKLRSHKSNEAYLPVIAFDKFVVLIYRLWGIIYQTNGLRDKSDLFFKEKEIVVTFSFHPFKLFRGKHGRGVVKRGTGKKGKFFYIVPILFFLKRLKLALDVVEFETPKDNLDDPTDPRTKISAATPVSDEDLKNDFSENEIEIIKDLRAGIINLSSSEIRAIGTHWNYKYTLEDINFEFDKLNEYLKDLKSDLNGKIEISKMIEVLSYIDECINKSYENKNAYENAYVTLSNQFSSVYLKNAIKEYYARPDEIFERDELKTIYSYSLRIKVFFNFLYLLAIYQNDHFKIGLPVNLGGKEVNWEEIKKDLSKNGFECFSGEAREMFNNPDYKLKEEYANVITEILNSIYNYNKRYC